MEQREHRREPQAHARPLNMLTMTLETIIDSIALEHAEVATHEEIKWRLTHEEVSFTIACVAGTTASRYLCREIAKKPETNN